MTNNLYASANDGWCASGIQSSWSLARASSGTAADSNNLRDTQSVFAYTTRGGDRAIRRAFFDFDTSRVIKTPSAAFLNIVGYIFGTLDVIVVRGIQGTTLAAGDFDALYGSAAALAHSNGSGLGRLSPVSGLTYSEEISTWDTTGYNVIPLNSTAMDDMVSLSTFKVCLMGLKDYEDEEHTTFTRAIGNYWNDSGVTALKPYLSITHGDLLFSSNF